MVPSDNAAFIDLQPTRARRHVGRIRHERDSVENHKAPNGLMTQCGTGNMEPKHGYTLRQLWADSEPAIGRKSSPSYEVKESDIRRAVAATADLPSSTLPDSPFILALGTPAAQNVPPQTGILAQRALEEWERTLCENKVVTILEQMQAGQPALIQKDGGEMLIAIVLDRPLADAKASVDDPAAFTQEMTRILLEKQSHLLIAQIIKPAGSSDPPPSNSAASSSGSHEHHSAGAPVQFQ